MLFPHAALSRVRLRKIGVPGHFLKMLVVRALNIGLKVENLLSNNKLTCVDTFQIFQLVCSPNAPISSLQFSPNISEDKNLKFCIETEV